MKKFLAVLLATLCVFSSVAVYADEAGKDYYFGEADMNLINEYNTKIEAKIAEIEKTPTDVSVSGTSYYISSSTGNDNNDGLTPQTAWKNAEIINQKSFKPGDGIFLKRGDTWRITAELEIYSGITLSAYGEGAKPKLICSIDASSVEMWKKTEYPDVYQYLGSVGGIRSNVGAIIFDGGRAWGIHVSKMLRGTKRVDNGPVFNGLEHYQTAPGSDFAGPQDLTGNLEFYHDFENEVLYLHCNGGNPGAVFSSIELLDLSAAIGLQENREIVIDGIAQPIKGAEDIVIDNIEVFGASFGVGVSNVKNTTVQNCIFKWIGGNVQPGFGEGDHYVRYGNAVESYGSSQGFTIRNNYASQVYDCCWTAQSQGGVTIRDLTIEDNVAEYANTGSEVWLGIHAKGYPGMLANMQVHNNYDRFIGYGFSHQRPSSSSLTDKLAGGWIGAGGFFYGANNKGMHCENNSVSDNVYFFAGGSANSVVASINTHFNFHDNIYFMEEGKKMGGQGPFVGPYSETTARIGVARGAEIGTKFYVTEKEPFGDMYKLCIPKDNGVAVFEDVAEDFWGRGAIDYVVLKGLFNGTSAKEFSPNGKMTRAMLVTVLSRLAGNTAKGVSTYTDVNQNAWYAQGVYWAEKNGIVAAGGKFRPDENATREEMGDMLYRYADMLYRKGTLDTAVDFVDAASITPAYADGIKFCTKNGIIGGYSDKTIKPKNNATRAEVATMIKRFVAYIGAADVDKSDVLARETDAIILKGNDLKKIIDASLVRATVEADNSITFVPFSFEGAKNESRAIKLLNAYNKNLDWYTNPYAVIKYNASNTGVGTVSAKATGAADMAAGSVTGSSVSKSILVNMSGYVAGKAKTDYKNELIITVRPWIKAPGENTSFVITEVVFFDNLAAAQAYMD